MKKQSIISRQKSFLWLAALIATIMFSINVSAQQNYVANLSSAQEVTPNASTGRGVAKILLNESPRGGGTITVTINYSGLLGNVVLAHIHGDAPVGATAPVLFTLDYTGGESGTISAGPFRLSAQQVADMKAQKFYINIYTSNNQQNGEIRGQIKRAGFFTDYDGDGRDDYQVFRRANYTFYTLQSLGNRFEASTFGETTPGFLEGFTAADFDGDGRSDLTRFRANQMTGDFIWIILQSETQTVRTVQWGNLFTGSPVTGDFDGDGKQDIAFFVRGTGLWAILQSSNNQQRYEYFGTANDVPVVGDYDRDGKSDLAVTRAVNGQKIWYIKQSSNNQLRTEQWGLASDIEFGFTSHIDFDGDNAADLVVQRNENGQAFFYVRRSSDNSFVTYQWGLPTDITGVGTDFDGDGKSDIGAIRKINGELVWFTRLSSTGELRAVVWGLASDVEF
jgi:hypothetical protein